MRGRLRSYVAKARISTAVRRRLVAILALSSSSALFNNQPALADFSQQLQMLQDRGIRIPDSIRNNPVFSREPVRTPVNIPVIPAINNDVSSRIVNSRPVMQIDSMVTKTLMARPDFSIERATPRMPTLPTYNPVSTQSSRPMTIPVSMPIMVQPIQPNSHNDNNNNNNNSSRNGNSFANLDSMLPKNSGPNSDVFSKGLAQTIDAISKDNDSSTRREGGGNRGNVQFAIAQPTTNQTDSRQADINASNSTINQEPADTQATVFTGKSLGSVVTSTFVGDEPNKAAVKKALSEKVALFEGTTLFIPDGDLELDTRHGRIHIGSRAVVLVSSSENEVAVYDIHDHKKGSVSVHIDGKKLTLAPGRHIVITTDQTGDFAMANAIESIPHCDIAKIQNSETKKVFTSEFSIPATIQSVSALKSLTVSQEPELQKVSHNIMKTAAIVMYMRGSQYKHYLRPRVTLLSAQ
ncbi:MAG: hypothetical protein K2X93_27560 [Candidatus Obscuribacterales bacterium]|nr:hypothetical protein [Candidatus Obscuribacterales bacterium]